MAFRTGKTALGNAATSALSLLFSFYLLLLWLPVTVAAPSDLSKRENITIQVPAGSRYLEDGKLLCSPSTWKSVAAFFFANYFAHAFTIKAIPGQTTIQGLVICAVVILHPVSGVINGVQAICQHALFCSRPLDAVSISGGLCVVVRTPQWKAQDGDVVKGVRPGTGTATAVQVKAVKGFERRKANWLKQLQEETEQKQEAQEKGEREGDSQEKGEREGESQQKGEQEGGSQEEKAWEKLKQQKGAQRHQADDDQSTSASTCQLPYPLARHSRPTLGIETFLPGRVMHFLPATGNTWSLKNRNVHGVCCLPPGYALTMLPKGVHVDTLPQPLPTPNRNVSNDPEWKEIRDPSKPFRYYWQLVDKAMLRKQNSSGRSSNEISTSYGLSKGIAAIVQTVFAIFTLFETRGDQIDQFGYAAFGLTVTPYLVMSIINLVGISVTPDYPAVYLVQTDVMEEASKRQGGSFDGMVARMTEKFGEDTKALSFKVNSAGRTSLRVSSDDTHSAETGWLDVHHYESMSETERDGMPPNPPAYIIPSKPGVAQHFLERRLKANQSVLWFSLLVDLVIIAIIGILSRFKTGSISTTAQRSWTMAWLAFDLVYGLVPSLGTTGWDMDEDYARCQLGLVLILVCFFGVPALGGYAVAGDMLKSYGSCRELF